MYPPRTFPPQQYPDAFEAPWGGDFSRLSAPSPGPVGMGAFAGPPSTLTPYRGVDHSVKAIQRAVLSGRGAWSPKVRLAAEKICERVAPKDYLSEILALRYWVLWHCPYFRDPRHVEWVRDPEAMLTTIEQSPTGVVRCDCDENTGLLAALWCAGGNDVDIVTVAFDPWPAPATHVFLRCAIPGVKGQWVVTDPVAGTKETFMLQKARRFWIYPLN